ncbi:hypothetical protein ACXIUS_30570 [Bosea thiooxidans]
MFVALQFAEARREGRIQTTPPFSEDGAGDGVSHLRNTWVVRE